MVSGAWGLGVLRGKGEMHVWGERWTADGSWIRRLWGDRTKRELGIPVEGYDWENGTNNYGGNDFFFFSSYIIIYNLILFWEGLTVDRIWRKTELLWPKVNVRVRHITRVMCCPFCTHVGPTWWKRLNLFSKPIFSSIFFPF